MSDPAFHRLLDIARRRKLTDAEEAQLRACLARDPQAKEFWEEEMALNELLNGLPDAPLASNFTAQVLEAVARDPRRHRRAWKRLRWFAPRHPARQWAAACLAMLLAALGYWRYESTRRERMAMAVHRLAPHFETPSAAVALAPDELWKNFDAINRLPRTQTDVELLAVLKEVAMK